MNATYKDFRYVLRVIESFTPIFLIQYFILIPFVMAFKKAKDNLFGFIICFIVTSLFLFWMYIILKACVMTGGFTVFFC